MGLVDFYATVVIVLIIIIFFFALKWKVDKMTTSITGEELGFDATQLGLLYVQAHVETSKGTLSFRDFIPLTIKDDKLKKELEEKTNAFFRLHHQNTGIGVAWKIITIQGTKEEELASGKTYSIISVAKGGMSAPASLLLPQPKPGDFIRIELTTVTVTAESIIEQYQAEK